MIVKLLESSLEGYATGLRFSIYLFVWSAIILAFYGINKLMKERNRVGIIAAALSIASPGSGFAYCGAYKRAWISLIVVFVSGALAFSNLYPEVGMIENIYVIAFLAQAIWSAIYAQKAGSDLRRKKYNQTRKEIETAYKNDLMPYINSNHHLAADTNFLMHFQSILLELYRDTSVHLFLHPTVFGELEGLKGNKHKDTRMNAQAAFDILELYQKSNRMQWTRRQKHGKNFSSADQRILSGVHYEIQNGVKLVFVSHDKGARILARSLQIPVVDPLPVNKKLIVKTS